jgi:hypothetical protein
MTMDKHIIAGVHITNRIGHVGSVQEVLTKYGCSIRTRLGLHETNDNFCSPNGLMILELVGDPTEHDKLLDGLNAIEGVEAKRMTFDHP